MKYDHARLELQRIIAEQQSVRTNKLQMLLNSMNVSFKARPPHQRDVHVEYLKGEIKKRDKELDAFRVKVANQRKEIKMLKGLKQP
jgi:hypothetical protein